MAWQVWLGWVGSSRAGRFIAWQAWRGRAQRGRARLGEAWRGKARLTIWYNKMGFSCGPENALTKGNSSAIMVLMKIERSEGRYTFAHLPREIGAVESARPPDLHQTRLPACAVLFPMGEERNNDKS